MSNTRSEKILSYMQDWRGGYWNLQTDTSTGVPERVADEVIAWHDLKESAANRSAYVAEFWEVFNSGQLVWKAHEDGTQYLELP